MRREAFVIWHSSVSYTHLDVYKRQAQYGVSSIPTMILFVDGKEAARMIGANPKGAIVDFINGQN